MRQYGIRIANVALFTLCSFLTASLFTQVAADLLIPIRAAPEKSIETTAAVPATWAERTIVVERNLFGSKLTSAPLPPPLDPEDIELEETKLPITLLGTVAASNPSLSTAAINDQSARTHQILRIGDFLEGHAEVRVAAIERKRVVLQNGFRMEELLLDEDAPRLLLPRKQAKRTNRRRRTLPGKGSRSKTRRRAASLENRVRELESELGGSNAGIAAKLAEMAGNLQPGGKSEAPDRRTPATIFAQARILPKYEDGEMVGIELNAIKPDSLYEKLGLSNGDVITELNGIPIDDASASTRVLKEFSTADQFNIMVRGPDGVRSVHVSPEQVAELLD